MGIFTSKYQRVLCKEVTLRDEAWALICAAKKRFESLCAKDSPVTDKAAETIAQLVLDIMESNTSGKETKTIQRPDDMDEAVYSITLNVPEGAWTAYDECKCSYAQKCAVKDALQQYYKCAYVGVLRYGQNQFELHYDRDDYDTGEPM